MSKQSKQSPETAGTNPSRERPAADSQPKKKAARKSARKKPDEPVAKEAEPETRQADNAGQDGGRPAKDTSRAEKSPNRGGGRRKSRSAQPSNHGEESGGDNEVPAAQDGSASQRASQPRKSPHDPAVVAGRAWSIYLAEISEEGVSLIDDKSARELARRCFKLAEIFMDEESRQG